MKLIGIMPCRNESWILGLSARVALSWLDELLILVHASTDRTAEIADDLTVEFPGRAWVAHEPDPKWDEMAHRQNLLTAARDHGATHIAIIDSDEILTGNLLGSIRHKIGQAPRGWMTYLPGYNLRGGLHRYHANGIWGERWFSVAFADDPCLYWGGDRFHHREPMGKSLSRMHAVQQGEGGILHLWGASERRLRAKHRLYKVTERIRWPNQPVREIEREYSKAFDPAAEPAFAQQWEYADVPAEWWEPYAPLMKYLDVDAKPWHDAEADRLIAEHGEDYFAGLDVLSAVDSASLSRICGHTSRYSSDVAGCAVSGNRSSQ